MSISAFLLPFISVLCFTSGILLAVGGYKLHVSFPFLPGLWAGTLVGAATAGYFGLPGNAVIVIAALLSVACAILTLKKPKAGSFLVFFSYGYVPGIFLITLLQQAAVGSIAPVVLVILALLLAAVGAVLGLLATRFNPRMWIIIETSLLGALLAILPAGNTDLGLVVLIAFLLIIGGGIYVQVKITGKAEGIARAAAPAAVPTAAAPAQTQAPAPAAEAAAPAAAAFCTNCGMPLEPGTKFCPECGHSTGAHETP